MARANVVRTPTGKAEAELVAAANRSFVVLCRKRVQHSPGAALREFARDRVG